MRALFSVEIHLKKAAFFALIGYLYKPEYKKPEENRREEKLTPFYTINVNSEYFFNQLRLFTVSYLLVSRNSR